MSDSEATEEPLADKYTPEQLVELWNAYMIEGARYGDLSDVQEALENKADVNAVDDGGRSALHCAAANGHTAIMQLLLQAGANTELRNSTGSTALHWACVGGSAAAVQLLLDNGAAACALNSADKTPLDGALENAEILTIFQRHGQAAQPAPTSGDAAVATGEAHPSGAVDVAAGDETVQRRNGDAAAAALLPGRASDGEPAANSRTAGAAVPNSNCEGCTATDADVAMKRTAADGRAEAEGEGGVGEGVGDTDEPPSEGVVHDADALCDRIGDTHL